MFVPDRTFGPYGPLPSDDIPYTVQSVPQTIITDQQAKNIIDILKNLPAVSLNGYSFSASGFPSVTIRGFNQDYQQSYRLNGMPLYDNVAVPVEALERVDVYEGLEGSLYGFAVPSGTINEVVKMPLDQPLTRATLSYTDKSTIEEAVDVSRRFGADEQFGLRVNVAREDGEGTIDYYYTHREVFTLYSDWKPTDSLKIWAFGDYNYSRYTGQQPSFYIGGDTGSFPLPAPLDPTKNYGEPWFFGLTSNSVVQTGVEWAADGWKAKLTVARLTVSSDQQNAGAGSGGFDPDLDHYTVHTSLFSGLDTRVDSYDGLLSRDVSFGPVEQTISVGANGQHFNFSTVFPGGANSASITKSFSDPQPTTDPDLPAGGGFYDVQHYHFSDVGVQDVAKVGSWLTLTGGLTRADLRVNTAYGPYPNDYEDHRLNPRWSVSVTPVTRITLYASYIEGLQPGASVGDMNALNFGALLPPYVTKQYEVGLKSQATDSLNVTFAAYHIAQPAQFNQYNPDGTYNVTQDGRQINQGLELQLAGKLGRNLALYGGATVIDARLHNTNYPPSEGSYALGVPRWSASGTAAYTIEPIPGLALLGSAFHTGPSKLTYDVLTLPGYTTFDLGGKYAFHAASLPMVGRLYVSNVAEKRYWGPSLALGDPRAIKASLQVDF